MKVLISAYSCAPHRGSEPGAGWNWSLAAAEENDVWVLTRERNRPAIEAELAARPHPRLRFVYVELPPWGLRLKKGERGIRYFSYYTLWQYAAFRAARDLHRQNGFDLVHHLTFANVWLPALSGFISTPFVLGPVGGGPQIPLRLYPELGATGAAHEAARIGFQLASRLNPLTRATWRKATTIIVQNRETRDALPRRHRSKVVVRPNASVPSGTPTSDGAPRIRDTRQALFAGRLIPWKGCSFALRAIAGAPRWSLTVIGSGPDFGRLSSLAEELGVTERVTFIPWMAQDDLWEAMARADALLLPSLRDDSPFVVGEAQAIGLPVVAFDQGGLREFAGFSGSTVITVPLSGADPGRALAVALDHAAEASRTHSAAPYELPAIARFLATTYEGTLSRSKGDCGAERNGNKTRSENRIPMPPVSAPWGTPRSEAEARTSEVGGRR